MKLLCDRSTLGRTICAQINHLRITQTGNQKMESLLFSADSIIERYPN